MGKPGCWRTISLYFRCSALVALAVIPVWCTRVDGALPVGSGVTIGSSEGLPTRRFSHCHGWQSTVSPALKLKTAFVSETGFPWRCLEKQGWEFEDANTEVLVLYTFDAFLKTTAVAPVIRA